MFRHYDVRGIWGRDIDPWTAEKLGGAIREVVGTETIALGRDVRFSSDVLSFHLAEGLGGEVVDVGITTTPMAYFFAWKEEITTLQVTASHNPSEYNGVKFVDRKGYDWPPELIRELEKTYRNSYSFGNPKKVFYREWIEDYFEVFESWDVPKIDLGFDPSNGAGYLLIPLLEVKFKLNVVNGVPDGRFPNHPPDPLHPESKETLKELNTTWGLLLDGDGDRLVVKYRERILRNDEIVAFLAEKGVIGRSVALEVTMPLKLEEFLKDLGIKVSRTPTGRVLIKQIARKEGFDFFAEYSGHFGFREFNYIDDPLFLFFTLLEASEGTFETSYKPPYSSNVISVGTSDEKVEELVSALNPEEVKTLDGFDVRTKLGRVVIRKSRTEEGLWRLFWESNDKESFKKLEAIIRSWTNSLG